MSPFKMIFSIVFAMSFLTTASASIFEPKAEERKQAIQEFVLDSIRTDETYGYLASSVKSIAFEKKTEKTRMRHPSCGAAWMGQCPKLPKEKSVITTKSYLAYGENFTCRVTGIWLWTRFDGSNLNHVEVNCF
jgi:hypothetical protein